MAYVDVLLFTGLGSYSHGVQAFTEEPTYETRSRTSGTYRIATYLRDEFDFDVEVVDFMFSWRYEELVQIVDSRVGPDTKLVGVGGLFYLAAPVIVKIFEYIKTNYPHVTTSAGSQDLWSLIKIPNIDYYCVGYGELGMKAIIEGNPEVKEVQPNPHSPKFPVVDCWENSKYHAYPWPDLPIRYEKRDFVKPHEVLSMETSRGCRFACSYCNFPILGVKGDYTRSQECFERNIKENYDEWGVTEYIITDDTFNDYIPKIQKYGDVVQSLSFEPNFTGYVRADLMTMRDGDLEQMARMRFNSHLYGIESTNHESAKSIGKGGKPEKILEGILKAKEYFIEQNGFYRGEMSFIWGLPYETPETIEKTFKWLDDNWVGEAVSMFPLHIMRDNGMTRPSDLTHKKEQYGYKVMQPIEVEPVGDRLDHIYADPNIDDYFKRRIKLLQPDLNSPHWQIGTYLWKNEHYDSVTAYIGVQNYLFGHDRYWDRGVPIFNQSNWQGVGFSKSDMMKTFRELPSMMNPPEQMVKDAIEEYKQNKLSL